MGMNKAIFDLLDISEQDYEKMIKIVSSELMAAIKNRDNATAIQIKAAAIISVCRQWMANYETVPEEHALIGIMIEQAYNAAVKEAMSKNPLSRIFKK
jgi:hypothetical protein